MSTPTCRARVCGWASIVMLLAAASCIPAAAQATKPATRPATSEPTTKPLPIENRPGKLLEGFEDVTALKGEGKLVAVTAGQGVTQGNAALQLPPGGTVTISISLRDITRPHWLRLDTLNVQPALQMLQLEFSGGMWATLPAVVQPGKDTLSLPLTAAAGIAGRDWDDDCKPVLVIRNTSDSPLVIDNLRIEPPADWPKDCRALDLGGRFIWPGFEREFGREFRVDNRAYDLQLPGTDPITSDCFGAWPDYRAEQKYFLTASAKGQSVAYLWLTHGSWGRMTAMEYWVKLNGKSLLKKQHSAKHMLSTDGKWGLMLGLGGEWTPTWFDKTYAPLLYDLEQVTLASGQNELEVLNTQVAAVVMGPANEKNAIAKAVEQVQKDISTYRRQFVAGRRVDATCTFAASDEETKAGMILLPAQADQAFLPAWQPTDEKRLAKLEVTVQAGGTAVLPLAVVPLKKGQLGATVLPFRTADGTRTLSLSRGAEIWFAQRVPRVIDATIYMQPWLLRPRLPAVKEREVVPASLVLYVAPNATEGTFNGQIKFTAVGGSCTLPVEVKVKPVGTASTPATFGVFEGTAAIDLYGPLGASLDPKEQERLVKSVRQELLKMGFNSLMLPAVELNRDLAANDDVCQQAIRSLGPKGTTGCGLFDVLPAHRTLDDRRIGPGSQAYVSGMSTVIQRTATLSQKTEMASQAYFAGGMYNPRDVDDVLERASSIVRAKGHSMAIASMWVLGGLNDDLMKRWRESLSCLMIMTDNGELYPKIQAFTKPVPGDPSHEVYLQYRSPDVYLLGFHAFGLDAQGWFLSGLSMRPGAYSGVSFTPCTIVAEPTMGEVIPTVSMLRMRQGQSDFMLARRAAEVVEQTKKAGVDAGELPAVLEAIRSKARTTTDFMPHRLELQSKVLTAAELAELRVKLIDATAAAIKNLPKK